MLKMHSLLLLANQDDKINSMLFICSTRIFFYVYNDHFTVNKTNIVQRQVELEKAKSNYVGSLNLYSCF